MKKSGRAAISLLCNSDQACQGSLSLTVKSKGKKLVALATSFTIKANKAVTLKGTLSTKVKALLAKASKGKLAATLSLIITTDQNVASSKPVTLVLTK